MYLAAREKVGTLNFQMRERDRERERERGREIERDIEMAREDASGERE